MDTGALIAVVGPSGVGKDSVMSGLLACEPRLQQVRRIITRAPGLGGEDYEATTPEEFARAREARAFCVSWQAHDLHYAIPAQVLADVRAGAICLANFSRAALAEANTLFEQMVVLHITASPEVLAKRLTERGRETPEQIAKRLAQAARPLPEGLNVVEIRNDGPLADTINEAQAALRAAIG